MNSKQAFGQRLRELMRKKKCTQEEIGRILGVTSSAISLYCRGLSYPECPALMKLASHFEVSTDYLLFGVSPSANDFGSEIGLSGNATQKLGEAMAGQYGDILPVIEFLLKSDAFYEGLEHCVQGFLTGSEKAAILMCSNGMYQVIEAEIRHGNKQEQPQQVQLHQPLEESST